MGAAPAPFICFVSSLILMLDIVLTELGFGGFCCCCCCWSPLSVISLNSFEVTLDALLCVSSLLLSSFDLVDSSISSPFWFEAPFELKIYLYLFIRIIIQSCVSKKNDFYARLFSKSSLRKIQLIHYWQIKMKMPEKNHSEETLEFL